MRFIIIALLFFLYNHAFARDGMTVGIVMGIEADTFKQGMYGSQISIYNGRTIATQNYFNNVNALITISSVSLDLDADTGVQNMSNQTIALDPVVSDDSFIRPKSNAQGLISLIGGVSIKYSRRFLFFRLGFSIDYIIPTENSFIWNDNAQAYTATPVIKNNIGITSQEMSDIILFTARRSGLALLPPTGGRDITISQKVMATRVDVPLSVALIFINTYTIKAYIGGGIGFYYGKLIRIIQDTIPTSVADVDIFEGIAYGTHLLIGVEYEIASKITLSAEMFYNYAHTPALKDKVISEDPYTVNSFYHTMVNGDEPGAEDRNNPRTYVLNFTGTRILLGINYYVSS